MILLPECERDEKKMLMFNHITTYKTTHKLHKNYSFYSQQAWFEWACAQYCALAHIIRIYKRLIHSSHNTAMKRDRHTSSGRCFKAWKSETEPHKQSGNFLINCHYYYSWHIPWTPITLFRYYQWVGRRSEVQALRKSWKKIIRLKLGIIFRAFHIVFWPVTRTSESVCSRWKGSNRGFARKEIGSKWNEIQTTNQRLNKNRRIHHYFQYLWKFKYLPNNFIHAFFFSFAIR